MPYWRLSWVYFSYFAVVGAVSPYWGLYLQSLGLASSDIGLLAAIPLLTKLISPNIWGYIADKSGRQLLIIRCGAFGGVLCFSALLFKTDFLSLAIFISLYSFFWNAILPQFEVVTLKFLHEQAHGYSRVRLWGSLGFIAAVTSLGYLFDVYPIQWLPWIIFSLVTMIFMSALSLPPLKAVERNPQHGSFFTLIRSKTVIIFFLVLFLLQLSHGVYYVFYSIYMESWGYSKSVIGWLWTLGVVCEIGIFILMPRIFRRYSLFTLLSWSLFLTGVRWAGIGFLPDNVAAMLVMQMLHAVSFGVIHATAIEYLRKTFGEAHQGQAQAFYSAFSFGGGAALGAYLSGLIWDVNSALAFYLASFVAILAWLLTVCFLSKRLDSQR